MDVTAFDGMNNSNYVLSNNFTMEDFHKVYNAGAMDGFTFGLLAFLILFILLFVLIVTIKICSKKEE